MPWLPNLCAITLATSNLPLNSGSFSKARHQVQPFSSSGILSKVWSAAQSTSGSAALAGILSRLTLASLKDGRWVESVSLSFPSERLSCFLDTTLHETRPITASKCPPRVRISCQTPLPQGKAGIPTCVRPKCRSPSYRHVDLTSPCFRPVESRSEAGQGLVQVETWNKTAIYL